MAKMRLTTSAASGSTNHWSLASFQRYQTADEYARSVVFICSPANSAISGQVICVDGAMTTAY